MALSSQGSIAPAPIDDGPQTDRGNLDRLQQDVERLIDAQDAHRGHLRQQQDNSGKRALPDAPTAAAGRAMKPWRGILRGRWSKSAFAMCRSMPDGHAARRPPPSRADPHGLAQYRRGSVQRVQCPNSPTLHPCSKNARGVPYVGQRPAGRDDAGTKQRTCVGSSGRGGLQAGIPTAAFSTWNMAKADSLQRPRNIPRHGFIALPAAAVGGAGRRALPEVVLLLPKMTAMRIQAGPSAVRRSCCSRSRLPRSVCGPSSMGAGAMLPCELKAITRSTLFWERHCAMWLNYK